MAAFDPDARLPVIVAGASGHAAVVIELLRAEGRYDPVGCTAGAGDAGGDVLGVPVLGGDDRWAACHARGIRHAIVAIGDNRIRAKVAAAMQAAGFTLASAVHPAAILSPSATIGAGVVVMAGAVVNARTTIGELAILNTRSAVDHDCTIGTAVHVAPGATLAGSVRLGDGVFVGAGATIVPGVGVGAWTIVGAGSLVLRDLGAEAIAYGVPARPRGAR